MMKFVISRYWTVMFVAVLIFLVLAANGYCDYRRGDVNNDGWCNVADLNALVCYFREVTTLQCMDAADIDGNGYVLGSDVTRLANFFRGIPPEPVHACPLDVAPCEDFSIKPVLYFGPASFTGNVCTLPVFMSAPIAPLTEVTSFHFSYYYDPLVFAPGSFTATALIGEASCGERAFPASYGPQPDEIVFFAWRAGTMCESHPIGIRTHVFDIEVTMVSPIPTGNTYYLCILDEDPIMGQTRFYLDITGGGQVSDDCLPVYCPAYITGDVNGDLVLIGADVTRLVNYFRGLADILSTDYYCTRVKW
ncbi:MAG: hypothetical protein GY839_07360 [candidate division Zixibacteria bacterium]|nr:hypothetical protein [candidate division Zixibacteria bacterium]